MFGSVPVSPPVKLGKSSQISKRGNRGNALKHGAFSAIQFLPWENPGDFEQLRQDLWAEHKPEGPSQEDAVETIAHCIWRKRRVRQLRELEALAKLSKAENHVFHEVPQPLFDTKLEGIVHTLSTRVENRQGVTPEAYPSSNIALRHLLNMSASFYGDQSSKVVNWTVRFAPEEFREHLEKNVPESNFETTRQWIVALKKEIDHVLIPRVRDRRPDPQGYAIAAAELLASETKLEELATEERLDASMDRALKRLFWLKTQKQVDRLAEQKIVNGQSSRVSEK